MKYLMTVLLGLGIFTISNAQTNSEEEATPCFLTGPNTITCFYNPTVIPEDSLDPFSGIEAPEILRDDAKNRKEKSSKKKSDSEELIEKSAVKKENMIEI